MLAHGLVVRQCIFAPPGPGYNVVDGHQGEIGGVEVNVVPTPRIDGGQQMHPIYSAANAGRAFFGKYLQPPVVAVFSVEQRKIQFFKYPVSVQRGWQRHVINRKSKAYRFNPQGERLNS